MIILDGLKPETTLRFNLFTMNRVVFVAAFVLYGFSLLANNDNCEAAPGTYQIIQDKKCGEVFTTDLLCIIEANRHKTQEVIISITANTQVRILPENLITSPNFIPLTEEVIDIEKYNYIQNYVLEMENNNKTKYKKNKKYETKY